MALAHIDEEIRPMSWGMMKRIDTTKRPDGFIKASQTVFEVFCEQSRLLVFEAGSGTEEGLLKKIDGLYGGSRAKSLGMLEALQTSEGLIVVTDGTWKLTPKGLKEKEKRKKKAKAGSRT